MVGCWSRWVAITADPMTSYGSKTSSGGMQMTNSRLLSTGSSPHRGCAISANPGRGHGGSCSDTDCDRIISWGRVVGASIFAVAVDHLLPWAADWDPLGGPSYFGCSCGLDQGLMEWALSAGVSSLPSNWMPLQLWRPLPLWTWPVAPLPTRVTSCFLPDSEVGQGLVVGPSQPNTLMPLHGWWYGVIGWVSSPAHQTSHLLTAKNGTFQLKGVPVGCVNVVHPLCLVTCLRYLKGGAHLLDKLLAVFVAGDLYKFPPPRWHLHMPHAPFYPPWLAQGRGLWIFGHWCWWGQQAISHLGTNWGWFLLTQELFEVRFQWRGTLQIIISFNQDGPSLFPLVLTNWLLHVAPPQSTTLAGATSRPHLLWHCILCSLLLVMVLPMWQRSPNTSIFWDWVTGSVLNWHPFGMESPGASIGRSWYPCFLLGGSLLGDLLVWPQVPHGRKSCGDLLLDIPRTWTSCISGCQSIGSCQSISG